MTVQIVSITPYPLHGHRLALARLSLPVLENTLPSWHKRPGAELATFRGENLRLSVELPCAKTVLLLPSIRQFQDLRAILRFEEV